ncbi:MAG: META domain-containing protein [Candidatus Adiutrix sp.]|jgi:heat shock protein HslJ|nr:META domain-containing protein [Candidatus Adiutrix sp.]
MNTRILALALALAFLLPAAGPARSGGPPEEAPTARSAAEDWPGRLAHRNFVLKKFNSRAFEARNPDGSPRAWPNLDFGPWPEASGRLCNNFRGSVELAGGRLKMMAAATRMMCLDDALNRLEDVFQRLMTQGADFALSADGRTLTLSGDGHTLVFTLKD